VEKAEEMYIRLQGSSRRVLERGREQERSKLLTIKVMDGRGLGEESIQSVAE
jgi:hypothetical protein